MTSPEKPEKPRYAVEYQVAGSGIRPSTMSTTFDSMKEARDTVDLLAAFAHAVNPDRRIIFSISWIASI